MADEITLDGRDFNFNPQNNTTNPYGLGGDGHTTIVPGESLSNFFLFMFSGINQLFSFNNTSSTSITIGTGSKVFTVTLDVPYGVGQNIKVVDVAAPSTNFMFGDVTAYNSSTKALTINVTGTGGSGTLSNWNLTVSGIQGAAGTGDVNGPGSSTDNALVRWDGAGGDTIQNSAITIDDSDNVAMPDSELIRPKIKDYSEVTATNATAGATPDIDLEDGNVHDVTLTASATFTFSNPLAASGASFTLLLRQDGTGGWTTTFPASVDWAGGTPPTLTTAAGSLDVLTFITIDGGTTWLGFLAGADVK